jgi:hypothetical protein
VPWTRDGRSNVPKVRDVPVAFPDAFVYPKRTIEVARFLPQVQRGIRTSLIFEEKCVGSNSVCKIEKLRI